MCKGIKSCTKLDTSKLSETFQLVFALDSVMDEYADLERMVQSGALPGLSIGTRTMKKFRADIDELSFQLLSPLALKFVYDLRTGNHKSAFSANGWFWSHLRAYPKDADVLCDYLAQTSPFWHCASRGRNFLNSTDEYMAARHDEWAPARARFDLSTLDRLLVESHPRKWQEFVKRSGKGAI